MRRPGLRRPQRDGIGNSQRDARIRLGYLPVSQFRWWMILVASATSVSLATNQSACYFFVTIRPKFNYCWLTFVKSAFVMISADSIDGRETPPGHQFDIGLQSNGSVVHRSAGIIRLETKSCRIL